MGNGIYDGLPKGVLRESFGIHATQTFNLQRLGRIPPDESHRLLNGCWERFIHEDTVKGPGITGFAHIGIQLNTRLGKRF